jgi:hypothetical protein
MPSVNARQIPTADSVTRPLVSDEVSGDESRFDQGADELPSPWRPGQLKEHRSAVGFHGHAESKEPAAMAFGLDGSRDERDRFYRHVNSPLLSAWRSEKQLASRNRRQRLAASEFSEQPSDDTLRCASAAPRVNETASPS